MEILDNDEERKPSKFKFKYVFILAILAWMLIIVGALFKIQSWEGGAELLTAGMTLFVFSAILAIVKLFFYRNPQSFLNK